jgi:hypothetical protein
MLLIASFRWLVMGIPFDSATYEHAAGIAWQDLIAALSPQVLRVITLLVLELGGNIGVLAGSLTIAIASGGLRQGERWAWFTLWCLPIHAGIDLATVAAYDALTPAALAWDLGLILITSLALLFAWTTLR